jgi:hypothetical protein
MLGLWTVEFGGSEGRFGSGVMVFDQGRLWGGDSGYYYSGTYSCSNDTDFSIVFEATSFVDGVESIFRTLDRDPTLNLVGSMVDPTHATAQGCPVGMSNLRLGVKLTKRA